MNNLREEELEVYKKCFASFDKNGDGKIDKKELKQVVIEMGLKATDEEVNKTLAEFDSNKDGVIELSEFLNMLGRRSRAYHNEAELRRAFREIDLNGNGSLDADELRAHFEKSGLSKDVSADELERLMAELDTNGDGVIQYEEFLELLYV